MHDRSSRFGQFRVTFFGCKIVHGCGGRAGGTYGVVMESGERCDSALDFRTAAPLTVIRQGTVIPGSVSITLQPLQYGSTEIFVEVGSDDKRGGSCIASAASLVSSVSVFLPQRWSAAPAQLHELSQDSLGGALA